MMTKVAHEIDWTYVGDAVPAFVYMAVMPFTYSIAYGLIAGIITYMVLNTFAWLLEIASGGRITPHNKHLKDPWTYKVAGGIIPDWIVRLFKGLVFPRSFYSSCKPDLTWPPLHYSKRDFWRSENPDAIQHPTLASSHIDTGIVSTIIAGTDAGFSSEGYRDPEKLVEKTPQTETQQI